MEKDYSKAYASVAEEFARRLGKSASAFVRAVVLFGSVARGAADPDSDLDVLVTIDPDSPENRRKIENIVLDVQLELQVPLSVKIYGLSQANHLLSIQSPFLTTVMREGKKLWPLN